MEEEGRWLLLGIGLENLFWRGRHFLSESWQFRKQSWWQQWRQVRAEVWNGHSVSQVLEQREPVLRKRYALARQDLTYGETFASTALRLLDWAQISSGHTVLDLGCGRGNFVFSACLGRGCRGTGWDIVPEYVRNGQEMARRLEVEDRLCLEQTDFRQQPLPAADLYYVAGTCLCEESWSLLLNNLRQNAPAGARLILLSRKLNSGELGQDAEIDGASGAVWRFLGERQEDFSWGRGSAFLYKRL